MFGKKYPFIVTVKITGRHPYMGDHTYDMFEGFKYEYVHVMARDYNHAEKVAMGWGMITTKGWAYTPISIRRSEAGKSLKPGRPADFYRCGQD